MPDVVIVLRVHVSRINLYPGFCIFNELEGKGTRLGKMRPKEQDRGTELNPKKSNKAWREDLIDRYYVDRIS